MHAPLMLSHATAVSALGVGAAIHGRALRSRRGGLTPNDFDAGAGGWIGRVRDVEAHHLPGALAAFDCRNNRLADLALRADGFADAVAAARDRHGPARIAVVLGTSTSGVLAAEDAFRGRDPTGALPAGFDHDRTQDLFSLGRYVRAALGLRGPAMVVSTACASSARCIMDAAGLIRAGVVDAAVVGGADSLCHMTLNGFRALEVVSPDPCRPCGADRRGISIGEAAGFALLQRMEDAAGDAAGPGLVLLGGGASCDGHHMSHPHPEGAGAAAAMRAALADAGLEPGAIDWVHLHGTGTRANDAAEDRAVADVFGPGQLCSSTKGFTGHTLGACGILGTVLAREAMVGGFVPGCLGIDAADPDFTGRIATTNHAVAPRRVMANAFGFGGVNCSLVLGLAGDMAA